MVVFVVVFFVCLFMIAIPTFFFAWGARAEIASVDAEYCGRLYHTPAERLYGNQWPIRVHVLFTEEPPAKVAGTIRTLRILFGVFLACAAGLVISFVLGFV